MVIILIHKNFYFICFPKEHDSGECGPTFLLELMGRRISIHNAYGPKEKRKAFLLNATGKATLLYYLATTNYYVVS